MLTAAQEIVLICQKVLKTNYQLALPEGLAPVLRATHLPIRGTHRGILDAISQGNSKRWQAFTAVGAGGERARHRDRGAWREDIGVYGAAHTGAHRRLLLSADTWCKRARGLYPAAVQKTRRSICDTFRRRTAAGRAGNQRDLAYQFGLRFGACAFHAAGRGSERNRAANRKKRQSKVCREDRQRPRKPRPSIRLSRTDYGAKPKKKSERRTKVDEMARSYNIFVTASFYLLQRKN